MRLHTEERAMVEGLGVIAGQASMNTVFPKSGLISAAAHRITCIYKACCEYITSLLSEVMSTLSFYGFQEESWVLSINNSQVLSI